MGPDRRSLLAGGGAALVLGGFAFRAWDRGVWSGGEGAAYAPWNNLEGSTADGITRPLRAAILAANPHDTQPWLFQIKDDAITLFADRARNFTTSLSANGGRLATSVLASRQRFRWWVILIKGWESQPRPQSLLH
jgi:hypothetical protein